jgi:hypothetical protein
MKKILFFGCLLVPFLLASCQVINSLQPVATAAPSGTLLFADDFSKNSNHWGILGADAGQISFLDGGLDIKVDKANSMIWTVAGKKYQDVAIDIDGVLLSGSANDAFGVVCRFQDNQHFYGFLVTHDGYDGIFKMQDGQLIMTNSGGQLNYSEAIRQGGVVNHILAVCQGDTLSLSVNGQLLAAIKDDSYSQGQVGIIAGAYAVPEVELFFDNLKVSQP